MKNFYRWSLLALLLGCASACSLSPIEDLPGRDDGNGPGSPNDGGGVDGGIDSGGEAPGGYAGAGGAHPCLEKAGGAGGGGGADATNTGERCEPD